MHIAQDNPNHLILTREEKWNIKRGATVPADLDLAAILASNRSVAQQGDVLQLLPYGKVAPQDRDALLGTGQVLDVELAEDISAVAQAYPGAIRPEHDMAGTGSRLQIYKALVMTQTSAYALGDDAGASARVVGRDVGKTFTTIRDQVLQDAANGNADAKAAAAMLEKQKAKRAMMGVDGKDKLAQARALGQGDMSQWIARYQEAIATINQLQQQVANLTHQLQTVLPGGVVNPPASHGHTGHTAKPAPGPVVTVGPGVQGGNGNSRTTPR